MRKIVLTIGVLLLVGFALYVIQQPAVKSNTPIAFAQEKKMEKKEGMAGEMKMMENKELDKIRKDLKAAKAKLAKAGQYSCCNAPPCDFCAIAMNMCPCGTNVVKGEAVCGECADGWSVGHGAIPDVDPAKVKREPHDMLKMGYDMRAKMYGEMKEMKK